MKKLFYPKLLMIILVLPLFLSFNTENNNPKVFFIYFFQDGKKIVIDNSTVFLRKAPFKMVIEFNQEMSVALNASLSVNNFMNMRDGILLENIKGFDSICHQKSYSPKKLIVADKAFSLWYFNSKDSNNFDSHIVRNDKIVGIAEFTSLFNIDNNKNISFEDINRKIYLSFVSYEIDKTGERNEFQREFFKIQWLKNKNVNPEKEAKKKVKEKKNDKEK